MVQKYIFAGVLAALQAGCSSDTWDGYVYPDAQDLYEFRHVGTFDSLDQCRSSALRYLGEAGWSHTGTFECGKNCRPLRPGSELNVCEETVH